MNRFSFPPEWAPHDALWFGWSPEPAIQDLSLKMMQAVAEQVDLVLMLGPADSRNQVRRRLRSAGLEATRIHRLEVTNLWPRDAGPMFITDGNRLRVVNHRWQYYGYPDELWFEQGRQLGKVNRNLAEQLQLEIAACETALEGGMLEFSSQAIIAYRDIARQRNPDLTIEQIEASWLSTFGKQQVIWLDHCPLADRITMGPKIDDIFGSGANGHIDEFVRFIDDATIAIGRLDQTERNNNALSRHDFEVLEENHRQLAAARRPNGKPYRVVTMPTPPLRHFFWQGPVNASLREQPWGEAMFADVPADATIRYAPSVSYMNFVLTNQLVLLPQYARDTLPDEVEHYDADARRTISELFPHRTVVGLDPLAINYEGGGMHCLTQQQPQVFTRGPGPVTISP